jgi:hypothetical protein
VALPWGTAHEVEVLEVPVELGELASVFDRAVELKPAAPFGGGEVEECRVCFDGSRVVALRSRPIFDQSGHEPLTAI